MLFRSETEGQGKTRPKKKVEGGSDVEDGEVRNLSVLGNDGQIKT